MVSTDFTIFTIICLNWRLRQITDLPASDKSQYFAITEFNNCFIIRSLSLFFNEWKRSAFLYARAIARRRKSWFRLRMSRILFAAKQLNDVPHLQTIICRQLFTGYVVGFRPMKREKFASNDNSSFYTIRLSTIYRNLGRKSFLNFLYPHPKI